MKKTPWFIRGNVASNPAARLFIFPHGGGTPSQYRDWDKHLGKEIEVYVASLPGRGARFCDEPISDMTVLIDQLRAEIKPLLGESSIFFGHSLGAIIAYELAKGLSDCGQITPKKVVVSAKNAPHIPATGSLLSGLTDDQFIKALQHYGGTPSEVLADKELMGLYLPMLRADFHMSENYLRQKIEALNCNIEILGAKDDPFTTLDGLQQWSKYTSSECSITLFEGGHFYFFVGQKKFFSALRRALSL